MKDRNIEIDISPKSSIKDDNGEELIQEEPKKIHVKEYYFYSEKNRTLNSNV